jgi:tetratricopeptide (TPR) repeat protein
VWITLAVVEPVTDAYAWTREYADRADRIFAIQSDMARDLAHALGPGNTRKDLPKVTEQPTSSLKAYDFFLRGNEYFNRSWERSDIETARQLYERALIADPNFALALAMLARCDASMFWERYDPSERRRQWAFDEAKRALALAPDLAEAHLALGYCYYHGARDFDRALAQFQKGLALDPNHSDLWNAVAAVHRRQGQIASAVAEFEQSLELDPRSHLKAFDVGLTLGMMRRFGEAEHYLERTTQLAPDYAVAWLYRIWLPILDKGDTARARAILNSAMSTTDLSPSKYYWILCRILPPSEAGLDAYTGSTREPVSYYLFRARRARFAADHSRERSYSDSARILLEQTILSDPFDAYAHSELGIALAGLGDRDGALAHGHEALALLPEAREAFDAPFLILNMAEIDVVFGELDDAVDQLEQLLQIPGFASKDYLRLDFVWAPLASHPRFRRLLQSPDLSSTADKP